MTTAVEQAQEIIHEALGRALNVTEKGAIATKWVAVIEFMGESGQKYILRLNDDESMTWDTEGMLQHALDHLEDEE